MKTFVATLGWTEWPVASAIIKHGLSEGDRIILFTPEKRDDRSKVAVNEVKNLVSKFAPSVEVSEVPVPVHDPARGMRALVLETILALSLLHVGNLVLELQTEDEVELRLPRIWEVPQELSGHEARAIKALGEKSASLSGLAKALRISVATAHRLLKRLEARDAVLSKKVGKERVMELTEKGRILLALMGKGPV
jgi:DNA-binding MarR family transcriptional regulator